MVKNIGILRCNPTCEMRTVCHSCPSTMPQTHARGTALKAFCRETRWTLIAGIAGMSVFPVIAWLMGRLP